MQMVTERRLHKDSMQKTRQQAEKNRIKLLNQMEDSPIKIDGLEKQAEFQK